MQKNCVILVVGAENDQKGLHSAILISMMRTFLQSVYLQYENSDIYCISRVVEPVRFRSDSVSAPGVKVAFQIFLIFHASKIKS